ncbi:MAG TPA: family 10 glycosylhydrolase [Armatimonadota bacterium]|nr:family 10 glycosylhydrolase [Armatimonadota bacterium]
MKTIGLAVGAFLLLGFSVVCAKPARHAPRRHTAPRKIVPRRPKPAAAPAADRRIERTLWVDGRLTDLSSPAVGAEILGQPIDRLIVSCFVGGETLFETHSQVFQQIPRYVGKGDALAAILAAAHRKGIKVYAYVNCLHWTLPDTPAAEDLLQRRPDFGEINLSGNCGLPADGKYASIFNPAVAISLSAMLKELVSRYPALDGVLLECRYRLGSILGYSDRARVAYINTAHIDPADLTFGAQSTTSLTVAWINWRLSQMSRFAAGLIGELKRERPSTPIAVIAGADWDRMSIGRRNTTLEAWPDWTRMGLVNEAVLTCPWEEPENTDLFGADISYAGSLGRPVKLSILLPLRQGQNELDPLAALETQQGQGVRSIVLKTADLTEINRAAGFWSDVLPKIAAILEESQQ